MLATDLGRSNTSWSFMNEYNYNQFTFNISLDMQFSSKIVFRLIYFIFHWHQPFSIAIRKWPIYQWNLCSRQNIFINTHLVQSKTKQNRRLNRTSKTNFEEKINSIIETINIFVQNRSIRIFLPALKFTKHYTRVIRVNCSFGNNSNCIVFSNSFETNTPKKRGIRNMTH